MFYSGKTPAGDFHAGRRSFLGHAASALALGVSGFAFSSSAIAQSGYSAAAFSENIGIGVHLGNRQASYISNFERVAELLKDIGIMHLRDDAIFTSYATRDHDFYQRIRALVGRGFRFDLVCQDPLNSNIFTPPRKVPVIYDWCDEGVEMFEGGNEPNLVKNTAFNPAISAEHQRTLYAVIKGTPKLQNIIVASPSYIQKNVAIAENLSDVVDMINIHPYPGMEHPETKGPGQLTGFMSGAERICGKKPVAVTETGYHTAIETTKSHLPVSESIKTRYFPRLLLWNFICGVKRTYIYELMDSFNNGLGDPESHFGLADFTGNPKPSFTAVKQLLALCRRRSAPAGAGQELKFNLTGDGENLVTAAFKRDDGSHLLFLWLGISGWNNATRSALSPVSRKYTLALAPETRRIVGHQFGDDGSMVEKQIDRVGGGFELAISDQLTALEITI
jgi:hypothetical protein